MRSTQWILWASTLVCLCLVSATLLAQDPKKKAQPEPCSEHCYVVDRLTLDGDVGAPPLSFALEGHVLAREPQLVPLFGPPERVRLQNVKARGQRAIVGFDKDHYFVRVATGAFRISGQLSLTEELSLEVPGPVNTFEARLKGGRVVEGSVLTGLSGKILHFEIVDTATAGTGSGEKGTRGPSKTQPTVFQLCRAVRVSKQTEFEYRLTMRSGSELGVVELPLVFGEKVLDVKGAQGWRVEGAKLLLPTVTRQAEITVVGTLPELGAFKPDPRSTHEWWLLESDPEHRLLVKTEGQRSDVADSPIPPQSPGAQLYLLKPGQELNAQVQILSGSEVLAAIIKQQTRTAVVTPQGDVFYEDKLEYENSGIDYLFYAPGARPVYLEADGRSQRIMHAEGKPEEVMIPLRTGSHRAIVQSLDKLKLSPWGGRYNVRMGSHALTASRASVHLGLPGHVVPLLVLGGDEPDLRISLGDVFALGLGFLVGWLLFRKRKRGVAAGLLLGVMWFAAAPLYVLILLGLALFGGVWLAQRIFGVRYKKAIWTLAVLCGAGVLVLALGAVALQSAGSKRYAASEATRQYAGASARRGSAKQEGGVAEEAAMIEGVTPVALPLPQYERSVWIEREFVSKDRPFKPVVYYVTGWTYWPIIIAWSLLGLWFVFVHRQDLREGFGRLKANLARPQPEAATTAVVGVQQGHQERPSSDADRS
jgi:hypothetical protein